MGGITKHKGRPQKLSLGKILVGRISVVKPAVVFLLMPLMTSQRRRPRGEAPREGDVSAALPHWTRVGSGRLQIHFCRCTTVGLG